MRSSVKQFMQSRTTRVLVAAGFAAALAITATGTTGAYFKDSKDGGITGTIGSVKLDTWGGGGTRGMDFNFENLMPGVAQSATVNFQNKGTGHQDFYLVFPNATALSALNDLGGFGEVHISVNGTEKFASTNLSDHYPSGTPGINGATTIYPVPQQMLLASDVAAGGINSFKFAFNYASKLGDANIAKGWPSSSGGGVFNIYPAIDGQKTIEQDVTGTGLPFQVVSTQVGQQP